MNCRSLHSRPTLAAAVILLAAFELSAVEADGPVAPAPVAELGNYSPQPRTLSLPAQGLFVGDQLSESTKIKLTELILDALSWQISVALVVPTGPWRIDGALHTDRDLNEARLRALRRFLTDRGLDPKRIYVENRIDANLAEPRLDVELVGVPKND